MTTGQGAEVIQIPRVRRSSQSDESTAAVDFEKRKPRESTTTVVDIMAAVTTVQQQGSSALAPSRLTQRELYPVRHAFSIEHITALRLLALASGRLQRALTAMHSGEVLSADLEVQQVQVLLPELFCCRALGDGFGTVVNAVISVFESLDGDPLNAVQLRTISNIFEVLKDKPFLDTAQADIEVDKLTTVGLNPYPPELTKFLSSDESIR